MREAIRGNPRIPPPAAQVGRGWGRRHPPSRVHRAGAAFARRRRGGGTGAAASDDAEVGVGEGQLGRELGELLRRDAAEARPGTSGSGRTSGPRRRRAPTAEDEEDALLDAAERDAAERDAAERRAGRVSPS